MTSMITPEVQSILKTAYVEGFAVRLTCGQLDRKTYGDVNEVLVRLGGKWKGGKTAAHLFAEDPTPLLTGIVLTGEMPPKNPLQFFPTPTTLAARVAALAANGARYLEPSAGAGALADAVRTSEPHAHIECVELSAYHAKMLDAKGYTVHNQDFLTFASSVSFDRVVMNPPFVAPGDSLAYITHINYAWGLLARGGRLVAVVPSGFVSRNDKRVSGLRVDVEAWGGWEGNDEGAFKQSGTGVSTVTLWMDKAV
jgi:hypothetical protein